MCKVFGIFILGIATVLNAQIPAPQIPLTGNIGCSGFPCRNSGTLIMPSDANYTMTAIDTSAALIKVTSSAVLTQTRELVAPAGNFEFSIENATQGGQAIEIIGPSGTGVTIPNGASAHVWFDGLQYVGLGGTVTGPATMPQINSFKYASQFQTPPGTGNNGIVNAFGSTPGQTVIADPGYANVDQGYPAPNNSHLMDFRNGEYWQDYHNCLFANINTSYSTCEMRNVLYDTMPSRTGTNTNTIGMYNNSSFNGIGFNQGTQGGGAVTKGMQFSDFASVAGPHSMLNFTSMHTGTGDGNALYGYHYCAGGVLAGADEGCESLYTGESTIPNLFGGAVTSISGNVLRATTTNPNCAGYPCQGQGRYLLDTQTAITSGTITAQGTVAGHTANYGTLTTSGATLTPATAYGYTTTAIPDPVNSQGTSEVFTVSLAGGTSGSYVSGQNICIAGINFFEEAAVTAVTPLGTPGPGLQSITATVRYPNGVGSLIMQGGTNCSYLEFTGGTSPYNEFSAVNIAGSPDGTTLWYAFYTGGSASPNLPGYAFVLPTTTALSSLTRSSNVVTASFSTANNGAGYIFNGISSATISGATTASFNGTISTPILTNNGQGLQWNQTGVNETSTSANIAVAGFNGFNLYNGAEVISVSDPAVITRPTPSSPEPAINGYFLLAANHAGYTVGDSLIQPLSQSLHSIGHRIVQNIGGVPPNASISSGLQGDFSGLLDRNFNGIKINNSANYTVYQGLGGVLLPPTAIRIQGNWGHMLQIDKAPQGGSPIISVGCPQQGCGSSAYNTYGFFSLAGTWPAYMNFNALTGALTGAAGQGEGFGWVGNTYYSTNLDSLGMVGFMNPSLIRQSGVGVFANYPTYQSYGSIGVSASGLLGSSDGILGLGTLYAPTLQVGSPNTGGTNLSVFTAGTAGTTSYTYTVVAWTANGSSAVSNASHTLTTGNAVLDGTNYNQVQGSYLPAAKEYHIWRTGGSLTPGYIGTVSASTTACPTAASQGHYCFNDTGIVGDGSSPPTTNTSGAMSLSGSQLLTSVQGTTGTKVLAATGTFTAGNLVTTDTNGNAVDSGSPAGITTPAIGQSSVTITGTTTTTLVPATLIGSSTLAAGKLIAGSIYIIYESGIYSTSATPGTATFALTIGPTTVTAVSFTPVANATNEGWELSATLICRSTTSCYLSGKLMLSTGNVLPRDAVDIDNGGAAVTVNTGSNTFNPTWTWAATGNSITANNFYIKLVN